MCGIGLTLVPKQICPECDKNRTNRIHGGGCCNSLSERDVKFLRRNLSDALGRRGPDFQNSNSMDVVVVPGEYVHVDLCGGGGGGNRKASTRIDDDGTGIQRLFRVPLGSGDGDGDGDSGFVNCRECSFPRTTNDWVVSLYASVLHMRGRELTEQPYVLPSSREGGIGVGARKVGRSALCWNGECYSYDLAEACSLNGTVELEELDLAEACDVLDGSSDEDGVSDTVDVMKILSASIRQSRRAACAASNDRGVSEGERQSTEHLAVASAFGCIHGEYAFIFYSPAAATEQGTLGHPGSVYFGRDPLGRRSLLMTKLRRSEGTPVSPYFIISSVDFEPAIDEDPRHQALSYSFEEIAAGRVYRMDLGSGEVTCVPIPQRRSFALQLDGSIDTNWLQGEAGVDVPASAIRSSMKLCAYLDRAVQRRVTYRAVANGSNGTDTCASVGILFSGGLDSVVLAALSHNHVPPDQPIDLINVAFTSDSIPSSSSPDRLAALLSFQQLQIRWPGRKWRMIAVDVPYDEVLKHERRICSLVSPCSSTMDFNIGSAFWFASRGKGREVLHFELDGFVQPTSRSDGERRDECLLRFASSVPAYQGGDVGFPTKPDNVRGSCTPCTNHRCTKASQHGCIFEACRACCNGFQKPISRYLGGSARICPVHNIVGGGCSKKARHVSHIGCTARANEESFAERIKVSYGDDVVTSSARILLVGIGADEQMAGYARHRKVFERGGYGALRTELRMEKDRLWTRNLGRDDRCISDHGKETRFPFLDEDVVSYLASLDVVDLCDMHRPEGEGDKMILRLVAKGLGVTKCSRLVKRAIQFGSRIAKVSDVDRFGSSRKASGNARHGKSKAGHDAV